MSLVTRFWSLRGSGFTEGVLREALNLNLKPENGLGMFMVKGPKP